MHFPETEEDTEMTDPAKEGDKNLVAILESNLKQMDAMAELVAKQGSALDEMTKHLTTIDKFGEDNSRQRRNQTRPRRKRETGNPQEKANPPSYFQRREGRTPRGTSPQSRRLDGSHRDNHRT